MLAFHAVEAGPGPLCIAPTIFDRQIRALHGSGYVAISVADVARHIREQEPFPDRSVAITFDDGYESVHRWAWPVLDSVGYRATVFPVTGELGGYNRWDADAGTAPRMALLSPSQVTELSDAGWEIGGHTHSHRPLPGRPHGEVVEELHRSGAVLAELCGRPVETFAYPYGRHDATSRRLTAAAYLASATIGARRARLSSALDRVERVDAWYLQRPWQARHLNDWVGAGYLGFRRLGRALGGHLK
ncbi:MAG: polysaccharide deacetylase family protein [Acidimicrobiales bacterium]